MFIYTQLNQIYSWKHMQYTLSKQTGLGFTLFPCLGPSLFQVWFVFAGQVHKFVVQNFCHIPAYSDCIYQNIWFSLHLAKWICKYLHVTSWKFGRLCWVWIWATRIMEQISCWRHCFWMNSNVLRPPSDGRVSVGVHHVYAGINEWSWRMVFHGRTSFMWLFVETHLFRALPVC